MTKHSPHVILTCILWLLCGCLAPQYASGAAVGNKSIEDIAASLNERIMQQALQAPLESFFLISAKGSEADVRKALALGADPNDEDSKHGDTPPLSLAAGSNPDPGVVRALLEAGADVNHTGRTYNRTPLIMAVMYNPNSMEVTRELLKARPNLYISDIQRNNVFFYANRGVLDPVTHRFGEKPREDLLIMLLDASLELPYAGQNCFKYDIQRRAYVCKDVERARFFRLVLNNYTARKKGPPSQEVLDAIERAAGL